MKRLLIFVALLPISAFAYNVNTVMQSDADNVMNRPVSQQDKDDILQSQGGVMCQNTWTHIMANVINMRRTNLPINHAHSMLNNSARSHGQLFHQWMLVSVNNAYQNPNQFEQQLNSGEWAVRCARAYNGY